MNNSLTTEEIKQRSVIGAKWLFITNVFNVLAVFGVAFFLGRTSTEALGAFGLVQVFKGVVSTFVLFGGQAVLHNFMAKVTDPELRGRLIFTYVLILAALMVLMVCIFLIFPGLLAFFLRRNITGGSFLFFIVFSMALICSELFSSAITGMMNIKIGAISQSVKHVLPLPIIAFLFIFNKSFLKENAWHLILIIYLFSFFVGACISAVALLKESNFKMKAGIYFPAGFMSFCLTTHLASIFSFVYNDVDRIFMLKLGEMGGLGMYQAVISVTKLIDFAPLILSTAIVPMFSSLLARNKHDKLKLAYDIIQRYSVVSIVGIGLFTISFSPELLYIFGSGYVDFYEVLAFMGLTSIICALFMGNTNILISYEKNMFRLGVSTLQIIIQITGTFLFISLYGVWAIAGFKAMGRVTANIINTAYILSMPLKIKIPWVYLVGILSGGLCFVMRIFVMPLGVTWSGINFLVFILFFTMVGKITIKDIHNLIQIFKTRKLQVT